MKMMITVWLVLLLVSVSCHPSIRGDGSPGQPQLRNQRNVVIGQPNPIETTFSVAVLEGTLISGDGGALTPLTMGAGSLIRMTCKVTYDRQLGKYFRVCQTYVVHHL